MTFTVKVFLVLSKVKTKRISSKSRLRLSQEEFCSITGFAHNKKQAVKLNLSEIHEFRPFSQFITTVLPCSHNSFYSLQFSP